MTTQDGSTPAAEDPNEAVALDWAAPDDLLQIITGALNMTEGETGIGVTLSTFSGLVSGSLISGQRWWAEQAVAMKGATVGDESESDGPGLADIFQQWSDGYRDDREARERGEDNGRTVAYIHLRDARFYVHGSPGLPGNGLLWRGRLTEVTGWGLGILGPAPE